MPVKWKTPQMSCPVIGDELEERFEEWMVEVEEQDRRSIPSLMEEWLVGTPDGALALRRLVEFPKQRALEFPDEERPWVVS